MQKIKKFLQEKKMLIIVITILLICSIAIALGVYAQITRRKERKSADEQLFSTYESLKTDFKEMFTNTINKETTANTDINYDELLFTAHNIKEEKKGKYKVEANYPQFKGETKTQRKINDEIFSLFGEEMLKISEETKIKTTYSLDYVAYVNNNIISLIIMCKYKDGENAQRKIVKCYNYDIQNDKLLTINDLIEYKNLNKDEAQKKITEEIKKANDQTKGVNTQGYNIYERNEQDDMYKIENTPDFFLGKDNYLYLVYAYGNNNYTDEIDLVIF